MARVWCASQGREATESESACFLAIKTLILSLAIAPYTCAP